MIARAPDHTPLFPLLSRRSSLQIVKNLTAVQKSVGHLRSDSFSSLANIGELSKEVDPEDIVLGQEGQRELAPYAVGDGAYGEEGGGSIKVYLDEDGHQIRMDMAGETSINEETEIWLRRQGVDKALVQGLGKGPDGIALAKVAAKRLRGKENGEGCAHAGKFRIRVLR